MYALVALLVAGPELSRKQRYRVGQPWPYEPLLWTANPDGAQLPVVPGRAGAEREVPVAAGEHGHGTVPCGPEGPADRRPGDRHGPGLAAAQEYREPTAGEHPFTPGAAGPAGRGADPGHSGPGLRFSLVPMISNPRIEECDDIAVRHGAWAAW